MEGIYREIRNASRTASFLLLARSSLLLRPTLTRVPFVPPRKPEISNEGRSADIEFRSMYLTKLFPLPPLSPFLFPSRASSFFLRRSRFDPTDDAPRSRISARREISPRARAASPPRI